MEGKKPGHSDDTLSNLTHSSRCLPAASKPSPVLIKLKTKTTFTGIIKAVLIKLNTKTREDGGVPTL